MSAIDWFALLHPVLVILFVYPVAGATIRLGILVRERRLGVTQQLPAVNREHADHGRWLTTGVVSAVLVALVYSFLNAASLPGGALAGGPLRLVGLFVGAGGTLLLLLALLSVKRATLRAVFGLLTWAALLALGSQPEIWRLSDQPLSIAFWGSHYWAGVLLAGLMLFTLAARPEITHLRRWRRLHLLANGLMLVLLAVLAITGCRDLLEIPLSWQKPAIARCDVARQVCPEAAPAAVPPVLLEPPAAAPVPHRG
jgi:hypothetical protein